MARVVGRAHAAGVTSTLVEPTRTARAPVSPVAVADVAAKVLLAACLVHALLRPELPQYQEKAMEYRLVIYPLVAALVPLGWWRWSRRRGGAARPYPWLIDLCVTAPFLFDSAGNAWHLYDTLEGWDDLMHVVTWIPWVAGFGLLIAPRIPDRLLLGAVIVGFGSVTHVIWEIGEYLSFVQQNQAESLVAYRDTIGDLALSMVGTFVGATAVALTRGRRAATEPMAVAA